ncbi:type II toxin-antitoxin system VapC family toxin [Patulibacter sp. NPDC049589]|uniref:type II toxin-antitoxin system VapC family toxin n=1 Tax=Patulibacter sp. NPDC049589 TaxID=3154731 RepID=UPI003423AADE
MRPGRALFLDTSALVKLFVAEPHSDRVLAGTSAAAVVLACDLAFVEAHATFARMRAGRRINAGAHRRIVTTFERFWADVAIVPTDDRAIDAAAMLARRHALRGYDAMHLAAGIEAAALADTTFACFDAELEDAAAREGLTLLAGTG